MAMTIAQRQAAVIQIWVEVHRAAGASADDWQADSVAPNRLKLDKARQNAKEAARILGIAAMSFRNNRAGGGQKYLNDAARRYRAAELAADLAEERWAMALEALELLRELEEADAA
jgi:hypothetical protein